MQRAIDEIITAGTLAPSGDNSQPWSFAATDNSIALHMHPEKDHALLNVDAGGTLLASGAALENMCIATRALGYTPDVVLAPDATDDTIATISLRPAADSPHSGLFEAVPARHSNRSAYKTDPLGPDFFARIRAAASEYESATLCVVNSRENISRIATASSAMEEIALQDAQIHRLFFGSILWSHDAHMAGEPGLHIRTLELPPPVQALFRILHWWPLVRVLNLLGFAKLAAKGNAQVYASSGAIAGIVVPNRSPRRMLQAGRLMQRVWLEAVAAGYAAQPLAGLLYLAEAVRRDEDLIAPQLARRAIAADNAIHEALGVAAQDTVVMLLRIGVPLREPTDVSRRAAPRLL